MAEELRPRITRKNAANNANQSSDLRQKMKKPTAHQTAVQSAQKKVNRAAYTLTELPEVVSARSSFEVSTPVSVLHITGSLHAL